MKAKRLYPTLSLGSRDDHITFNFGQDTFMFDIANKVEVSLWRFKRVTEILSGDI